MVNSYEPVVTPYSTSQRVMCATLGLASTLSVSASASMANAPMPVPVAHGHGAWQPLAHVPVPQSNAAATWSGQASPVHQAASSVLQNHAITRNIFIPSTAAAPNDINLASPSANFLAGNLANFRDLTIQVGRSREVVSLGTKLTAAEVVAVAQVIAGGKQTIRLNSDGVAAGGTVRLDSTMMSALDTSAGGSIGSMTVTHGVKLVDTVSQLTLSGQLSNYGNIQTASVTAGGTSAISADTILNAAGASISSYSGKEPGLYASNPSLNAQTNITNYGSISSAGNLTLNAPVVVNSSAAGGGTITAAQNVNINTQTLDNSGAIAALTGNINVASNAALTVNGAGGSFQAQAGNINFSSTDADLAVNDGMYDSLQTNLSAGTGNVDANIGEVTGTVNASGNCIHINADSTALHLGDINASGDPMFTNTGDLLIDGSITATNGADLTLIAGGNVISTAANTSGLDTSSTTGSGGNLTVVAGANFKNVAGVVTITDSGLAGKGSATGGQIDLTGGGTNPISAVNTSSSNGDGGYVQMVAYSGSNANSGTIAFPTNVGIDARSTSGGTNGDVSIIAGALSGTALSIGGEKTEAGAFLANNVSVSAMTPTVGAGAIFNVGGTAVSGINSFSTTGAAHNADLLINGNTFITGDFTGTTAGKYNNFGFLIFATGNAPGGGSLAGAPGRNVTINADGGIGIGIISASGGGGTGSGSFTPTSAGGVGGNGGNVTLNASSGNVLVLGSIDVSGGGGGGGAGGSTGVAATAGGAGGQAGTVTLSAGQGVFISKTAAITAYDGGAGGAGGSVSGNGTGGGGGGGSGIGGGGGGGGGGTDTVTNDFGAGGGAGFGGDLIHFTGGLQGGGGAGSFGTGTFVGSSTGGGGGSANGFGLGGNGDLVGFNGASKGVPQAGDGGSFVPTAGGAGSTVLTAGGGGGQSSTSVSNSGQAGGAAAVVSGHGSISITAGTAIGTDQFNPTDTTPINIETSTLAINSGGAPTSASSGYILSAGGVPLTITAFNAGTAGTLQLSTTLNTTVPGGTNGAILFTGTGTGGTIGLTTGGSGAGASDITISGTLGGAATLTTTNGGAVNTTGAGIINGSSLALVTPGGASVKTNVNSLTVSSPTNSVFINQQTKSLDIGASTVGGVTFDVTSLGQVNVKGALSNAGGIVSIHDADTGASGIDIGAKIDAATIVIQSDGTLGITASNSSVLTSPSVSLTSAGSIGSSTQAVFTQTPSLLFATGTAGNAFLNDATTTTLTVTPSASVVSTGTMSIISAAGTQLNIVRAPFATVSITDTGAAPVLLNSGNKASEVLGTGGGTFTVSSKGNIDAKTNTAGIKGTSVSLTSSAGAIGSGGALSLNSPTLVLKAATSVDATDSQAAAVTGSATTSFTLFDTAASGTGIAINSAIAANQISLVTLSTSDIAINGALGSATANSVIINSGNSIVISAPITTNASTGSATLTTNGTGSISATNNSVVSGSAVNLNSANSVGSGSQAIFTNSPAVTAQTSTSGSAFVNDAGTGTLTFDAPVLSSGTLSLISAANTALNIVEAPYDTVSIKNNGTGPVLLNSGNQAGISLGIGTGDFTVTSVGSIDANLNAGGIQGTTVSLTSSAGSIGAGKSGAIQTSAPALVLDAPTGSVFAKDIQGATVTGSASSSGTFSLSDSATTGTGITINSAIGGGTVSLTTTSTSDIAVNGALGSATATSVTINSGGAFASTGTGTIDASTITITAATKVDIGGTVGTTTGDNIGITANGTNVTIGDDIGKGATKTVNILAAGSILEAVSIGTVRGSAITLKATTGDIGSGSIGVFTQAGKTLTADGSNGSIFLNQTGNLTINTGDFKANNILSLNVNGTLNIAGALSTNLGPITISALNDVTVNAPVTVNAAGNGLTIGSTAGNLAINQPISAPGFISFTAGKDLTQGASGTITTPSMNLSIGGTAGTFGATPVPIVFANLKTIVGIVATTPSGSANIVTNVSGLFSIGTATMGATSGQLQVVTQAGAAGDGSITVSGVVKGPSITLQTNGGKGPNDIVLTGTGAIQGGVVNLTAGGSITSNTGTNIISGTAANLQAGNTINVSTNVSSLTLSSGSSGAITVSQGATDLSITGITEASPATINIVGLGQVNTTGAITDVGGTVNLKGTSIDVGGKIDSGSTGSVSLISTTGDITDSSGGVVTASTLTLTSAGSIGGAKAPVNTAAASITTSTSATGDQTISDSSTATLTFNDKSNSSGTLNLTSQAATLNVVNANSAAVTITDKNAGGNVVFGSGSLIGTGAGVVSVSTGGNIDGADATATVQGTSVTLTSTSGAIGSTVAPVLASPVVALNASSGSVTATDSVAITSLTGSASAGGSFNVTDTAASGTGITVAGGISAQTINLKTTASNLQVNAALGGGTTTSITLDAGQSLALSGAGTVQATTINLKGATDVTAGGLLTGNSVTITATGGSASETGGITGTGVAPSISISGGATVGTAVTIGGAITAPSNGTITITGTKGGSNVAINANVGTAATSSVLVNAGGAISDNGNGTLTASTVSLTATGGDIGTSLLPILTAAGKTLTINATNGSSFVNQTGDISLGATSAANTFSLDVVGTLTITGAVSTTNGDLTLSDSKDLTTNFSVSAGGGHTVTLKTTGGNLAVNQSVSGGAIVLFASGDITQGVSGVFTAPSVDISVGGNAGTFGATPQPLTLANATTLKISSVGLSVAQSANIVDNATTALTLSNATLGATSGQLKVVTNAGAGGDGTINVTGTVTGSAITLTTGGTKGPNNIIVSGSGTITGGTVNLTAGGAITSAASGNIISGTSATLSSGAAINVETNVSSLTLSSGAGSPITVNQGLNALTLASIAESAPASIIVLAAGTLSAGSVTNKGGVVTLQGTSLDITGAIDGGNTGTVKLTATTGDLTDSGKATVTADSLTLSAGGNIGASASAPISTIANSIAATLGKAGNLFVSDSNTSNLSVDVQSTSSGTMQLTSTAGKLTLVNAPVAVTTISNTAAAGSVFLASGSAVGTGAGAVSISTTNATGGDVDAADNTVSIKGTSVTLSSAAGSVGKTAAPTISSPTLILNAAAGSVNATDTVAATSVTGSAKTSFTLSDSAASGVGLSLGSTITADTISLSTTGASDIQINNALGSGTATKITVSSGGSLTTAAAASLQATTLSLTAAKDATINGTMSGNAISVTATNGVATLSNAVTGTGKGSTVTISGTASGATAVSIAGTITADTINATSNGTGDISVAGKLGTAGTPATDVNLTAAQDLIFVAGAAINSTNMNLTAGGDITTPGALSGTDITVHAGGTATISNTITGVSGGGSVIDINGGKAVDILSAVAGDQISITSGASAVINLGANVGTAATKSVTIAAGDAITGSKTSTVFGDSITLSSASKDIGTTSPTSQPILTQAGTSLTINAAGGSSYVQQTGGTIALGASAANGTFSLISTGTVNVTGAVSGAIVTLTAATLSNSKSINGSASVALTATGSGSAFTNNAGSSITGGTVTITDTNAGVNTIANAGTISGTVVSITQGAAADTISNTGSISGTTSVTLANASGAGFINNTGTASISAPAINITSGKVTNSATIGDTTTSLNVNIQTPSLDTTGGTVSAASSLTIANINGDLSIAAGGNFTTGNAATLNLSAKGNITVAGAAGANPLFGLTQLHNFFVNAGGNFTTPLTGITVIADGKGDGGTINIAASTMPVAAPFVLSAIGTTGNGGSVTLNLPGTASAGISVGKGGTFSVLAGGKTGGGTLNLITPGQINLDTTDNSKFNLLATDSTLTAGANVSLNGTKGVLITGNLDTHTGTGAFGDITITTGASTAFTIGAGLGATNGQTGLAAGEGLFGKDITINDSTGLVVNANQAINSIANPSNSLTVNGSNLTNNGVIGTNNLTINSPVALNFTTAGGGTFSPLMQSITLSATTGSITIAGKLPAAANTINLTALKGAINFGKTPATLTAAPDGSGNGGTINLQAQTLSTAPLTLDAAATGSGNGGTVSIILTGTTALKVASGALVIHADNAGTGKGGSVTLATNANITADAKFLTLGNGWTAGNGANLSLAGKTVHLSNVTSLPSSGMHNVSFTSSAASFTIGGASAAANGMSQTNPTFAADNITIINNGGTIIKGTNTGLIATNSVTLKAKTDIGQTGTNKGITITAPTVSLIGGGSVYAIDKNATTTYTALSAGKILQLSAGDITAPAAISGATLNLTLGSVGAFTTNATTITASVATGGLNITDSTTALLNLNAIKAPGGDVTIATGGALTAKSPITTSPATGAVSLTSTGLLSIKGAISAAKSVTLLAQGATGAISQGAAISSGTISMTAKGTGTKGTIVSGGGTFLAAANTITLSTNGANIGTTGAGFRTGNLLPSTSIDISVDTGGNTGAVNITNKDTSATGTVNLVGTSNVGSLKLTATNSTGVSTNQGTLNVGAIHAKTGAVFITTNEQHLNTTGLIDTKNGNITLQDTHTNTGSVPLPVITIGADIYGSSTGSTTTGNVFIAIGTVPTSGSVKPGVTPAGVVPGGTTPTKVTFGTTTNKNGSITADASNQLVSKGRNLSFTTGGATSSPTQIKLNNGVNLTADPPPGVVDFTPTVAVNALTISAPPLAASQTGPITIGGNALSAAPISTAIVPASAAAFSNAATISAVAMNGASISAAGISSASATNAMTVSAGDMGATSSDNTVSAAAPGRLSGSAVVNRVGHRTHGVASGAVENLGRQSLESGALLLAPDHDTVVDTPFGPVRVGAGAVALLVSFGKGLAVYDLHDGHKGAVAVGEGQHVTTLVPGRTAVLAGSSVGSFEEINPAQLVGYRQLTSSALGNSKKLFQAEFEIMSVMRGLKPLASMASSNREDNRKTMHNILKTAAILMQINQRQEAYRLYNTPEKMAYIQSLSK